ncbi:MAG: Mur ligase family protein, partial [Candidatus Falkowbacteria bacterium]|nr:Mur ligase family protein [Candidatus Falkowbacteria bacterium]
MLTKIKKLIPLKLFRALQTPYHYLMNLAAALVYRFPANKLIVIGVTGTTGKTSVVYLIAKALEANGYKVGYTSTAQFSDGSKEWLNDKKMTMVDGFFTQRLIRQMFKNACQYAIIETTSEGIKQWRHTFINYDVLVFTGLYPEHIEAHGSFEKYKITKGELFKHLKNCHTKYINDKKIVCRPKSQLKKLDFQRVKKTIIVNGDDDQAPYFLSFWSESKFIYSALAWESRAKAARHFRLDPTTSDWELIPYGDIKADLAGTEFIIDQQPLKLKLLGDFNAQN